jgi:hypothetical protein
MLHGFCGPATGGLIYFGQTFSNWSFYFSAPWNGGQPGVAGPSPVIYSGQPTGPNGQPSGRPLFPSAAGKSTFPAYGE